MSTQTNIVPDDRVELEPDAVRPTHDGTTSDAPEQVPDAPEEGKETDAEKVDGDNTKTPEWYEAELERARKDAAKYRTRSKSIEEKFEGAKTLEEFEAARQEWAEEKQQFLRENVAVKHGLPDELASLLKGNTREELEAHAKSLAKYVAPQPVKAEPRGGLDPQNTDPEAGLSPAELAKRIRR